MSSKIDRAEYQSRMRWVGILAIGLSLFLSALDATIVALGLPEIAVHFRVTNSLVAAVILAYVVPLTVLILPASALIRRFRTLSLFIVSVSGFGIGSLVCGLAPSFLVLLIGRVVQGSFAAIIATQGLALAAAIVLPSERGRAMGIVGTIAPLGGIIGPGVGGILLASSGWSSIFYVNLPVVLVASLLGLVSLRGVALKGSGSSGQNPGQTMSLLGLPQFMSRLFAFFCSVSASVALYYFLPFDLTEVDHIDPSVSGLLLLCMPLGMVCMGVASGYLADRYGSKPFILAGSGLLVIGSTALSLVVPTSTSAMDLSWRLFLIGAGTGLFTSPNMATLMSIGGRAKIASASAIANLAGRIASVLGPLVVGTAWTFFPTPLGQMMIGVSLVDVFAVATLLLALLSISRKATIGILGYQNTREPVRVDQVGAAQ